MTLTLLVFELYTLDYRRCYTKLDIVLMTRRMEHIPQAAAKTNQNTPRQHIYLGKFNHALQPRMSVTRQRTVRILLGFSSTNASTQRIIVWALDLRLIRAFW